MWNIQFGLGLMLGALTRILASGDSFDPRSAFWFTQVVLSATAAYVSFKCGFGRALLTLFGAYLASNFSGYLLGSSESRAWALLGAFSSLFVIFIYPVLAATLGWIVRKLIPANEA